MKKNQINPPELNSSPIQLSAAIQGQQLRLIQIDAGKQVAHRLTELGLTPGVELTIVHDSGGPMVLSVRDSRVAIGRGMAGKLRVEPIL
ncbi:MAG: FeoA family protein [Candidatus Promineifilaceae bacterium]|nr:FeoA family protein [Candidatus Promineifilaceae bacterium]